MFENSKKTNKILETLVDNNHELFFDRNNRKKKIFKIIEDSKFELEKAELIIETLVKGLREIYLAGEDRSLDKILMLIDFYNKYTSNKELKISLEKDESKSSIEKRLDSIQ